MASILKVPDDGLDPTRASAEILFTDAEIASLARGQAVPLPPVKLPESYATWSFSARRVAPAA